MPQINFTLNEIINTYDSRITRAYCRARFKIIHLRFLNEIGQYFPTSGRILDIGCGFGLFSLYYAKLFPNLEIIGLDINEHRILMARNAAKKLSISNCTYEVANATSYSYHSAFDAVYMLDIVHHIPRAAVLPLIKKLYENLNPNCRLIIKDVNTKPAYKLCFTYLLDKMLDIRTGVNYWEQRELMNLLESTGFVVFHHSMVDLLPYPHILYICQKPGSKDQ